MVESPFEARKQPDSKTFVAHAIYFLPLPVPFLPEEPLAGPRLLAEDAFLRPAPAFGVFAPDSFASASFSVLASSPTGALLTFTSSSSNLYDSSISPNERADPRGRCVCVTVQMQRGRASWKVQAGVGMEDMGAFWGAKENLRSSSWNSSSRTLAFGRIRSLPRCLGQTLILVHGFYTAVSHLGDEERIGETVIISRKPLRAKNAL